jgi:predicted ribosome quality control (RQC) complex YloA/Tae2 family protein
VTTSASLLGARIRRIDAPSPDLWAITLAATEVRGTLLVSLQPGATGIGWSDKRPHGLPASSFVQKLRKELEGGRLQALDEVGSRLELSIARAQQALQLAFDFSTQNVLLYASETLVTSAHKLRGEHADGPREAAGRGLGARKDAAAIAEGAPPESEPRERRVPIDIDLAELEQRARALLEDRGEALLSLRKNALARGLRATRKKLERKQGAIAGDAARADEAPALRQRAQLLMSNLHAIARGATNVSLLDYTIDPPANVDIKLDPAQHPRELAEAWFKRAKRFERGAALAAQRVAAGAAELASLAALEKEIEASADTATLDELAVRAERVGVKSELPNQVAPVAKSKEPTRHVPYRTLLGAGDRQILVGKGASDNDVLTRDHARSHDLWLHARDVAGAHVVVPLAKNEVCPQELLIDAAHAAAHYSEAKGEATVDISYTPRRYVRKPKGSPPGLVTLEREKVLRLHIEPARLAKLLQTDRP